MKIILAMATGGLIGYFTNWLAIKMLFRPLEEIYLFGWKVPFTPGLIPKEKLRIAKNIGRTVEDYLLSPEAILKSLEENDFKGRLKKFIDENLETLKNKDYVLGDLAKEIPDIKGATMKFQLRETLKETIVGTIRNMELKPAIERIVNRELASEENRELLLNWTSDSYENFIKREATREILVARLEEGLGRCRSNPKSLEEVLPVKLLEELDRYIDENYKLLGFKAREIFQEERVKEKIKASIRKLVEENVGGLLASLIPMEMVGEKGYLILENYLESETFKMDLRELLKLLVDTILKSSLEDISKGLGDSIDLDQLAGHIISILDSGFVRGEIFGLVEVFLDRLDREKLYSGLEEKIRLTLESETFNQVLTSFIDRILEKLGQVKLSSLIVSLYIDSELIYTMGEKLYKNYLSQDIDRFIRGLEFSSIVEKTIIGFDNEFTEKLILDIASKELRAITILGGVLGMLIGGINPIIQSIL